MRLPLFIFLLLLIPSSLAEEPLSQQAARVNPVDANPLREVPQPLSSRQMVRDSGVIFSGTVLNIEHLSSESGGAGITRISFRVQNAIRGVRAGQVIQIQEWGGLWNAGERYRRGENVVLFLYPKSKLGLTSPVGAAAGRFQVDKMGRVEIAGRQNVIGTAIRKPSVSIKEFAAAIRRAAKE